MDFIIQLSIMSDSSWFIVGLPAYIHFCTVLSVGLVCTWYGCVRSQILSQAEFYFSWILLAFSEATEKWLPVYLHGTCSKVIQSYKNIFTQNNNILTSQYMCWESELEKSKLISSW